MQQAPESIAGEVSRELKGEAVVWASSPDQWAYARTHWQTALLAIPFTALAVYWFYGAVHPTSAQGEYVFLGFLPLSGLMFMGSGIWMLCAPLRAAWVAGRVYYVVTERRAVIFEKQFRLRIRSFSPLSVAGFERISRGGPGGDIIFDRVVKRGTKGRTRVKEIGFIGLAELSGAERALNSLVSTGKASSFEEALKPRPQAH